MFESAAMTLRLVILTLCLLASSGYIRHKMQPERVPIRQSLSRMPQQMGQWTGGQNLQLTDQVVNVLGVDDYVSRVYRETATQEAVGLYIGYYDSQRDGDTIHSPMNCLPGAGWQPMATSSLDISVPTRSGPIAVKRVLIQKGLDKQVVLYWYQSHGRVIGNEYWSKVLMVYDAVRLNRSDAALVRIVSPVGFAEDGERAADLRAVDFVQSLFGQLDEYLPS
jgi:EpsI family protein